VPFQVQPTYAWTEPSPTSISEAAQWFASPGATTCGASVGEGHTFNSQTVTIPVTGTCPVGTHLMLAFGMTNDLGVESAPPNADIAVTDNKGGNVLQFDTEPNIGFAWAGKFNVNGVLVSGWVDLYRINTQLIAGDTITVTFSGFTVYEVRARAHVVTGVRSPNVRGPNAGGNLVGFGTSQNNVSSPQTLTLIPTPKWVGPTVNLALVVTETTLTAYEISFARGGHASIRAPGSDPSGKTNYEQVALPELILEGGCTIEIASRNRDGSVRAGDTITDVRLWVEEL
jgi:hypothetical protein